MRLRRQLSQATVSQLPAVGPFLESISAYLNVLDSSLDEFNYIFCSILKSKKFDYETIEIEFNKAIERYNDTEGVVTDQEKIVSILRSFFLVKKAEFPSLFDCFTTIFCEIQTGCIDCDMNRGCCWGSYGKGCSEPIHYMELHTFYTADLFLPLNLHQGFTESLAECGQCEVDFCFRREGDESRFKPDYHELTTRGVLQWGARVYG